LCTQSTHQDIQVILSTDFLSRFSEEQITSDSDTRADLLQELITRWDSEREVLRSAPGSYPSSLK